MVNIEVKRTPELAKTIQTGEIGTLLSLHVLHSQYIDRWFLQINLSFSSKSS